MSLLYDNEFIYIARQLGDVDDPEMSIYITHSRRNSSDCDEKVITHMINSFQESQKTKEQRPVSKRFSQTPLKLTIPEIIQKVNDGSMLLKCLRAPLAKTNLGLGDIQKTGEGADLMLKINYKRHSDGTLEVVNEALLKKQKKVLGYLLKQFGSALLSGRSVMTISLPVTIFEKQSLLERTASNFLLAPHFLEKGAKANSPLDQFKYTLAFFIASLHHGINPEKPFNPILGETFQGLIDGCPIYLEQVSHHPPMCAYQMLGRGYEISGLTEFAADISTNSVKSKKMGYPVIKFNKFNTKIIAEYPAGIMSGTTFGKRTFYLTGKLYLLDEKNRYYAEIEFDLDSGSIFKKRKTPKDHFEGGIYEVKQKFVDKFIAQTIKNREIDIRFKEKEHAITKLEEVEGNWMEYLNIGGQTYWTIGNPWPYHLHYFDNPLPSDSNYRKDILQLRAGNEDKAQEAKLELEELQRRDRKLREQGKHKGRK